jgi:23S rRNA (guanosine2251-2'-O)-methyltransferase
MPMKKTVEAIYQLFTGLEKDSSDGIFDQQLLEELINLIASLEKSDDIILQKLSKHKNSLTAQMTIRHFSTIAVPFERYLKKNITDDDFLISSTDRDHLVMPRAPLHFILDNLRSAFNVGSVFRTADTLGAAKIWLTGYTPTPHQLQVEKSALGSTFIMDWEQCSFETCIEKLKSQNIQIISLETTAKSRDITADFDFSCPTALLIGNERFGLDSSQLSISDDVRRIPTYGIKNSLNASVAAAIAGFEWRKQYNETLHKV